MSKDKRSSPRVLNSVSVEIQIGDKQAFRARTLDLSQGGVLLDSPTELAIGETLTLVFKVGKNVLNPITGDVRRVDAAFGGLRFCVAIQFAKPNFQLVELAKRDAENSEKDSSWTVNPTRTFW